MCITFTRARAMDDRIVLTGEVMGLALIVRTPERNSPRKPSPST